MLNTPPTWNWYLLGLTVQWMLDEGGVAEFAQRNARKSALLYAAIDGSGGFYRNEVDPAVRSRMNVPFFLQDEALDKAFLAEVEGRGPDRAEGAPRDRRHARVDLQRDARGRRAGAGGFHAGLPAAPWLRSRKPRSAKRKPRQGGGAGRGRCRAARSGGRARSRSTASTARSSR